MTPVAMVGGWARETSLDDFLAGAGSSTVTGERLMTIGTGLAIAGVVTSIGLIVFLALVHRGLAREVRVLLALAAVAGVLVAGGAAIETAGLASVRGIGWTDALTGEGGSAALLRFIGGILVALGLFDQTRPTDPGLDDGDVEVRWVPGVASAFGIAGAACALASFQFDGHTVTRGPRLLHGLADAIHVAAAGVWVGGVVALAVCATMRRAEPAPPVGPLVRRFSDVAAYAVIALIGAGVLMALMIIDDVSDLVSTAWGERLLVKLAAVAAALAIGAYHRLVVVPALRRDPARRVLRSLAAEVALFGIVVAATAFLVDASPN